MNNKLTPYDTGLVLEPRTWVDAEEARQLDASELIEENYGKVDFDNDESTTEFTVQILKNDPIPSSGERYTIRITSHSGEPYIVQEEE